MRNVYNWILAGDVNVFRAFVDTKGLMKMSCVQLLHYAQFNKHKILRDRVVLIVLIISYML